MTLNKDTGYLLFLQIQTQIAWECLNAYGIVHKNDDTEVYDRVILPYSSFPSLPLRDHNNDSRAIQHVFVLLDCFGVFLASQVDIR